MSPIVHPWFVLRAHYRKKPRLGVRACTLSSPIFQVAVPRSRIPAPTRTPLAGIFSLRQRTSLNYWLCFACCRERREAEVRELESREREAKLERERIEKQRAAEQAVHKHFEESLRLAQQKVSLLYTLLTHG
jgi:hypothetical protein